MAYTADPNDLNPANLARDDALTIYANHDKITPDQDKSAPRHTWRAASAFLPIHAGVGSD